MGPLGPGVHKVLFEPSKCLWWVSGLISKCDFALPTVLLGLLLCPWTQGIVFLVGPKFLVLMIVQERVATVELSQEQTSAHPSALPSCAY